MLWGGGGGKLCSCREIHPLDPQPHRHSMLVPRVCAPQITGCSLGKYWSSDFFQQAANPGGTQVIYDSYSGRQRNLMMHAQCPLRLLLPGSCVRS